MNKPEFKVSVDAQTLATFLASLKPGELATKQDLSDKLPGRQLFSKDRHILTSALKLLLREYQIVMGCVRKVGYKRLEDAEIVDLPVNGIRKIARCSVRTVKKAACANYGALDKTQQIKYNTGLSIIGAIHQFTKPNTRKLVENSVSNSVKQISFRDTVALFGK